MLKLLYCIVSYPANHKCDIGPLHHHITVKQRGNTAPQRLQLVVKLKMAVLVHR